MKMIKAVIRNDRACETLEALVEAGMPHATVTQVLATGPSIDPESSTVSLECGRRVNRMLKLELMCGDQEEAKAVEVIRKSAYTGQPGDGVIVVLNLVRMVKIRTANESLDAL